MRVAVVGGGAAGFFGAIAAAEQNPAAEVVVFETTDRPLDKVRISGGGRCNVTHHCFDPAELIKNYPRGHRELRGPLSRFGPQETIAWFEQRGVTLKVEDDGRMFPTSDRSRTIIDCLIGAARSAGVQIRLNAGVKDIAPGSPERLPGFTLSLHDGSTETFDRLLLATGSSPRGYRFAAALGHTIIPCVPSLFTFKVKDLRLEEMAGVSFDEVALTLRVGDRTEFRQTGPMLITHWGLSGPAVLKLSAWAARELHDAGYGAILTVGFTPGQTVEQVSRQIDNHRREHGRRRVIGDHLFDIPRRYWERVVAAVGIDGGTTWSHLTADATEGLVRELTEAQFAISGKGIFKDEFVTCGGVSLREVDFKTMASRVCAGLFLAGEILDIDGVTGGFNFQSAWCTGWTAGQHLPAG